MPIEDALERSREMSPDGQDDMLANVPAPFDTPFRGSATLSAMSDEGSLILNESESGLGLFPSPSAATSSSRDDAPPSISRLMFGDAVSSSRSGAPSPTNFSALASMPVSPIFSFAPDPALEERNRALEAEIEMLRTEYEEKEAENSILDQRISSLEHELSTAYSIAKARDASNGTVHSRLKHSIVAQCFTAARREWEGVVCTAEAEADAVAAERQMLQTVFASIELLSYI